MESVTLISHWKLHPRRKEDENLHFFLSYDLDETNWKSDGKTVRLQRSTKNTFLDTEPG